ncbi:hypothetical protein LTR62_007590 [Meristemomyces frigidus]|uniref:Uncharacterized protein n=1 Tax=Meristemomyces frigidus TaxID=1508187 RepID=A0AAN7TC08_9PEZI|nr:hypothetical protein LTR62_007590 [Meristemomyces frigidus]
MLSPLASILIATTYLTLSARALPTPQATYSVVDVDGSSSSSSAGITAGTPTTVFETVSVTAPAVPESTIEKTVSVTIVEIPSTTVTSSSTSTISSSTSSTSIHTTAISSTPISTTQIASPAQTPTATHHEQQLYLFELDNSEHYKPQHKGELRDTNNHNTSHNLHLKHHPEHPLDSGFRINRDGDRGQRNDGYIERYIFDLLLRRWDVAYLLSGQAFTYSCGGLDEH